MTWKFLQVPPQMAKTELALLEATETWIEEQKKAGFCIEIWQYTDGGGGVAIVEAESNDVLHQKLLEAPYSILQQYCVTPLTDMKVAIGEAKKLFQKIIGMTGT